MVKTATLIFRLEPALKARLQDAARAVGVSLTTFTTAALTRAIEQAEGRMETGTVSGMALEYFRRANAQSDSGVFRGIPTFMRGALWEASSGGANGYEHAGWTFGIHVEQLLEEENERDAAEEKVKNLVALVVDEDTRGFAIWLRRNFPKIGSMIPARRRSAFLAGIQRAIDDGRLQ